MTTKSVPSLALVATILYGLALLTPALVVTDRPLFGGGSHDQVFMGYQCLIAGWVVLPAWLANPLLLVAAGALACGWRNLAALLASAAFVAGLATLFLFGKDLQYPHVGFFLWLGSIATVFVAAIRNPKLAVSA